MAMKPMMRGGEAPMVKSGLSPLPPKGGFEEEEDAVDEGKIVEVGVKVEVVL